MFTFTKVFFPGLPNLGAQIRCTQNRYIAVQKDLKYPLGMISLLSYVKNRYTFVKFIINLVALAVKTSSVVQVIEKFLCQCFSPGGLGIATAL